uniref:Leukocyte receptor cluster member 1 n=1 Tax=Zeugodacus cucurbitae TaxID=28588 RepID=A0A0A1XQZ4_ZEUCU
MNILPKKRWHVRTKDNIARVRRDEAAAKEEEQKRQEKLLLAESEARINFLRKKSGVPISSTNTEETSTDDKFSTASGSNVDNQQHVDLFSDYKSHIKKTNKALEDEKKEEQEKYEKQIGYLTYLGQDTNEALKLRSWYEVAPQRSEVGDNNTLEKDVKNKLAQDPLTLINALLPSPVEQKKDAVNLKKRSLEDYISTPDTPPKKIRKHENINEKSLYTKEKKSKKHKKHKHKKDKVKNKKHKYEDTDSDPDEVQRIKREKLEKLRKERLMREANERARQEELLAPKKPVPEIDNTSKTPQQRIVQKYNSQFNPEIAKQNMI